MYARILVFALIFLTSCGGLPPVTSSPSAETVTVAPSTETLTLTPTPSYPWTDEHAVMSGICFEAAYDAAGQVFVLRSADDHIRFYGQVDNAKRCRHPVKRLPFDFSTGRVLAGLWSKGIGCTARHEVLGIDRSDEAKTLTIQLRFVTEGDCNYELVRPFWIGLDGVQEYAIALLVVL